MQQTTPSQSRKNVRRTVLVWGIPVLLGGALIVLSHAGRVDARRALRLGAAATPVVTIRELPRRRAASTPAARVQHPAAPASNPNVAERQPALAPRPAPPGRVFGGTEAYAAPPATSPNSEAPAARPAPSTRHLRRYPLIASRLPPLLLLRLYGLDGWETGGSKHHWRRHYHHHHHRHR